RSRLGGGLSSRSRSCVPRRSPPHQADKHCRAMFVARHPTCRFQGQLSRPALRPAGSRSSCLSNGTVVDQSFGKHRLTSSSRKVARRLIIARDREAGTPIGTEREVMVRRKSAQRKKGSPTMHQLHCIVPQHVNDFVVKRK